jgi:hypothetical protein
MRRLLSAVIIAIGLGLIPPQYGARALGPITMDWEQLPLTQRVSRLDALSPSVLFARTTD